MTTNPADRGNGETSRVLVLSGSSSSGKSTTAREFQRREPAPWLILDADTVLGAFPFALVADLETTARGLNRALFRSVAEFAREGFDVICEQVFWSPVSYEDAIRCLVGLRVRFVEVTADLRAAEEREALRSGRNPGTSREQRTRLFGGVHFDYSLDTTAKTPAEAAAELGDWVGSAFPPTARISGGTAR